MPAYRQPLFETEMSRRAVLLDTNVLVAAFWPPDERHKDARAFLDMMEDEGIVGPYQGSRPREVLVGGDRLSSEEGDRDAGA